MARAIVDEMLTTGEDCVFLDKEIDAEQEELTQIKIMNYAIEE